MSKGQRIRLSRGDGRPLTVTRGQVFFMLETYGRACAGLVVSPERREEAFAAVSAQITNHPPSVTVMPDGSFQFDYGLDDAPRAN